MKTKRLVTWVVLLSIFFLTYVPASLAEPVRIMPLGDSITGSPGCWRALLWKDLIDNGFTDIDFVGTAPHQGCAFDYDADHEGHSGYWAASVAKNNELVGWLAATNPDIVLMHFGTNDIWNTYIPLDDILAAFTTLVNQMRQNNPDMIILVARIIPLEPRNPFAKCNECPQRVIDLNNKIPAWAHGLSTDRSPIVVVDHWSGFNPSTDTDDGVHPNDAGIRKIADNWYGPLASILSGVDPGTQEPESDPATNNTGGCEGIDRFGGCGG